MIFFKTNKLLLLLSGCWFFLRVETWVTTLWYTLISASVFSKHFSLSHQWWSQNLTGQSVDSVMFLYIARLADASCISCHMALSSFCNSHSPALAPAFMLPCTTWSPQVQRSISRSNSFSSRMLGYVFTNARLILGPSDQTCITLTLQRNPWKLSRTSSAVEHPTNSDPM